MTDEATDKWLEAQAAPALHYTPSAFSRRQRLSHTLLGGGAEEGRCAQVVSASLAVAKDADPLFLVAAAMQFEGFTEPEEVKAALAIPQKPLICRAGPSGADAATATLAPLDLLRAALLLGLSNDHFYDPARPIIWTRKRLARSIELFDPEGFYR